MSGMDSRPPGGGGAKSIFILLRRCQRHDDERVYGGVVTLTCAGLVGSPFQCPCAAGSFVPIIVKTRRDAIALSLAGQSMLV